MNSELVRNSLKLFTAAFITAAVALWTERMNLFGIPSSPWWWWWMTTMSTPPKPPATEFLAPPWAG